LVRAATLLVAADLAAALRDQPAVEEAKAWAAVASAVGDAAVEAAEEAEVDAEARGQPDRDADARHIGQAADDRFLLRAAEALLVPCHRHPSRVVAGRSSGACGVRAGCVFCVERDTTTAQLRILLVERWARGLGIGARLVAECERFARQSGYRRIRLWTQSTLLAARAIYAKAGYRLVGSEEHHSFGADLVGEVWELALA